MIEDKISDSAKEIRRLIENAINTSTITMADFEKIAMLATADAIIDNQEKALLGQFHELINDKTIKFVK